MNKEWSDKNKKMQALIDKEATFTGGVDVLLDLRNDLLTQISYIVNSYPEEAYYQMPFSLADTGKREKTSENNMEAS